MLKKWKQISSHICCENQWIRVREDSVLLPTGEILDSYIVAEYLGAVGILFFDEDKILMIKQYRYPMQEFTWEIPSGALSAPDQILESARRELREETGYTAESLTPLCKFYSSPGSSNEIIHLVVARDIQNEEELSDGENLFEVCWFKIKDVISGVLAGEITHSPTIIGLFISFQKGLIPASHANLEKF